MIYETAVFVFTRDRPETLRQTLQAILAIDRHIVLVDDSAKIENRRTNAAFCSQMVNTTYLGQQDFESFTKSVSNNSSHSYTSIFRKLGHSSWNLGYARNFALCYAKLQAFSSVLFMDDDIIPSKEIIDNTFGALSHYDFSGAKITGLADDSLVGHIASALNVQQDRMLSGGFIAFRPSRISYMFLNCYNEDWIWLSLELPGKSCVETGEVYQQLADPLSGHEIKVAFQEFGEVAFEGVSKLAQPYDLEHLATEKYWLPLINWRISYLHDMETLAGSANEPIYQVILRQAGLSAKQLCAKSFADFFREYITDLHSLVVPV